VNDPRIGAALIRHAFRVTPSPVAREKEARHSTIRLRGDAIPAKIGA